jgi:hypothetical protein
MVRKRYRSAVALVATTLPLTLGAACGGPGASALHETTTPVSGEAESDERRLPTPPEEGVIGAWECTFASADVPVTHTENPSPEATAAFARGTAARDEGRFEEAITAYGEALRLDPTFSRAAYALGVVLAGVHREEEAVLAFERVIASDPTSIDALFNLGILFYVNGEAETALRYWLRARTLAPRDLDATKKVVQAYHALGRFREAAVERRELRRIRACSEDRAVRSIPSFVIDQFDVGEEHVLVFELFEPNPTWTVFYAFQVVRGDQPIRVIQLESDPVSREQGVVALLGIHYPDNRHFTTRQSFEALPTYESLRPAAIELIRESAE